MKSYQQFLAELKRRHVFKVAGIYGVVSYGVLEAADLMLPRLGLPDWTVTFMVAIVVLAFPVALILAWAFELTPEGVRRLDDAEPGELETIVAAPASQRWPSGLFALVGVLALVVGTSWIVRRSEPTSQDAAGSDTPTEVRLHLADLAGDERPSLAVLPFVNMSADPEQEYFSDGITEEVLNALANVDELRVSGRTSAFAYKGRGLDLRQIGRELGVRYLIEGSVRKAGDQLRITAQLIDARDGSHLWSEQYDRPMDDVFAIQTEIAESIAAELRVPLGLEGDATLVTPTADLAAYDLYLAGRSRMRGRGSGLLEARELFLAALVRDSTWAPAWAALAEVEELRIWYEAARPEDMPRAEFNPIALDAAERAARRALELDPKNASALVALGSVHRDRAEWNESEAAYLRALELDPDNAEAHQQYGDYLLNVGRIAEGVRAMDRAAVLDPAPIRFQMLGDALAVDDRYTESIEAYEHAAARETAADRKREILGGLSRYHLFAGQWEDAIQAVNKANRLDPEAEPYIGSPAQVEAFVNALREGAFERVPDRARDDMRPLHWMMVGQVDSAVADILDYSGRAAFGRVIEYRYPLLSPIRSDPRVQAILAERGLAGVEERRTPIAERTRPRALGQATP